MPRLVEIVLYVVLPLGWGLAVEYAFERLRRRRARRRPADEPEVLE